MNRIGDLMAAVALTDEERVLLLQIVNSVNIPGKLAEQIVEIKRKLAPAPPDGGSA